MHVTTFVLSPAECGRMPSLAAPLSTGVSGGLSRGKKAVGHRERKKRHAEEKVRVNRPGSSGMSH